jgi:hypothetical protein
VAKQFEPPAPAERLGWLFAQHMPELPDVKRSDDFSAYTNAVMKARATAAQEIAASLDWPSLLEFATDVELRWHFGAALANSKFSFEDAVVQLLDSDDLRKLDFALGFTQERFRADGWPWIESIHGSRDLTPQQEAWLLLVTYDFPMSWERAESAGTDVATKYWSQFRIGGLGPEFPYVELVARRLLAANRPKAALEFLAIYQGGDSDERAELMAEGLEQLLASQHHDAEAALLDEYELMQVFSHIADSSLSIDRIAKLEWAYLPAFGYDASPPTLSRYLAENPAFFVEVISRVYRPRTPDNSEGEGSAGDQELEPTDQQRAIATNAYRLLSQWRAVPGLRPDGSLDHETLSSWVADARRMLADGRRLEVGDLHIGQVLAASPPERDGVWPAVAVRDLLESVQSPEIEDGLRTQLFNDRGTTSRGVFDGGEQERVLVAKYREQAEQLVDRWPRVAAVLNDLADSYERDARHEDAIAEQRLSGLDF